MHNGLKSEIQLCVLGFILVLTEVCNALSGWMCCSEGSVRHIKAVGSTNLVSQKEFEWPTQK